MGKINPINIQRQLDRVEAEYADAQVNNRPLSLSPTEIIFNPHNLAAANDDEESIRQLASSIEAVGLIHPLTVNKIGDHQYMLLSGERRYKAITTHLHWDHIPCVVYNELDTDMVTVVTIQANMEVREYSVADRLALYQQLQTALRSLKDKGKYKGGIGRGIAEIMGVSEQQIGKYKKLCNELDTEQLRNVTNIDSAVRVLRRSQKTESDFQFLGSSSEAPLKKTESDFQFLAPEPPIPSSNSTEVCQCVTCTCTGCHEECYGQCRGCGNMTTDCNSFQTDGEKWRTDDRSSATEPSVKPIPTKAEYAAIRAALAATTELMALARDSDISDKVKQHLFTAHAELVKYEAAAGLKERDL